MCDGTNIVIIACRVAFDRPPLISLSSAAAGTLAPSVRTTRRKSTDSSHWSCQQLCHSSHIHIHMVGHPRTCLCHDYCYCYTESQPEFRQETGKFLSGFPVSAKKSGGNGGRRLFSVFHFDSFLTKIVTGDL